MNKEDKKRVKEKPLTREDVLKLIEEHGGPDRLDLSGRNLEEIDLSSAEIKAQLALNGVAFRNSYKPPIDLHGIILEEANLKGAFLDHANLQGAKLALAIMQNATLGGTNLQDAILFQCKLQHAFLADADLRGANLRSSELKEALLWNADLERATLEYAELQEAQVMNANLKGANLDSATLHLAFLEGVIIDSDTNLRNVDWGRDYIIGEEKEQWFKAAQAVYCMLTQWYTQAGIYDVAGKFHYREMEMQRKATEWWLRPLLWKDRKWWGDSIKRLGFEIYHSLCGYGEKPLWVIAWAAVVIVTLAGVYTASELTVLDSLYYSAASFTALGYGSWVDITEGWVKGIGLLEAFIGVFMMALFLVTFVRKMTR